jgi:hypothetical protein
VLFEEISLVHLYNLGNMVVFKLVGLFTAESIDRDHFQKVMLVDGMTVSNYIPAKYRTTLLKSKVPPSVTTIGMDLISSNSFSLGNIVATPTTTAVERLEIMLTFDHSESRKLHSPLYQSIFD